VAPIVPLEVMAFSPVTRRSSAIAMKIPPPIISGRRAPPHRRTGSGRGFPAAGAVSVPVLT
jgi:hypothetical protein